MTLVVTLEDFRPPDRFDAIPWEEARIEESATVGGLYTELETVTLSPLDSDPENPQLRSFTTALGTAEDYWYRVVFIDGDGNESLATTPIQNSVTTVTPYATVDELARILKIREPSAQQTVAMERVLITAAGEIDSEIDLAEDEFLSAWQTQLATEVNLERAVEHWRQQESPFGIVDLGVVGSSFTAKDSWERHANKLAPLKGQWGFA